MEHFIQYCQMPNHTGDSLQVQSLAVAELAIRHHYGRQAPQPESFPENTVITANSTRDPRRVFLDRLAYIFARSRKDRGNHVSATVLVHTNDIPTIFIAKNNGCKGDDRTTAFKILE
jgi:hypothetical protein